MAGSKYDWRRYGTTAQNTGAPQGVGTGSSGQPANTATPPSAAPPPQYAPNGYQPITNTHSIIEANRQNRLDTTNRGNELNQQAGEAFNYYGGQEANYGNQAAGAYGQLQQQPGYTPGQAGQINVDYSQYNTPTSALDKQYLTQQEQQGIAGDPYKAYNQPYQQEQGNISNSFADTYSKQMAGAQTVQSGTAQAAGGMQGGLNAATSTEQTGLNTAANRGDLQVSDQDVSNIKDAAGRRVGNQYQSLQEDVGRRASASGMSPAAYSAMMSRYSRQSAEQQGQAETEADVAARQYKLGAAQTQAGMQMGAAATGGQAAQNAAYLGGEAGMQAAEAGGQAQMQAGAKTGDQALGEEQHMADLGVNAMQSGEAQASQRAAGVAGNRQATMQGIQGTQYGQGTNSAQLTAGGAANVGQTAISGQNAYRNYLTGEQQLAQGGQMGALGTQANVYGAQNTGLNQSQANENNYENGQHATGVAEMGTILGAASAFFDEGGVATRPTYAIVGERGPELITNLPQLGRQAPYQNPIAQQMASQAPAITTAPPDTPQAQKYGQHQSSAGGNSLGPAGGAVHGFQSGGWTGALKGALGATPIGQAYSKYKASSANAAAAAPTSGGESIGTITGMGGSQQQYEPSGTLMNDDGTTRQQDPYQPIGTMDQSMADSDEMAGGGTIVTKPTRVLLGERGPEAVVPLTPRSGNNLQPSMLGTNRYMPRTPGSAPSPYSSISRGVGPLRSMAGKYGQRITA